MQKIEYYQFMQWRQENGIDNDPDDKYARWAEREKTNA